jgi:hypothetical protein
MSTVGLRDRDLNVAAGAASAPDHALHVKRRMSTGSGILSKTAEPAKKKRRNVSFGGAHVRLFDKNANGAAPAGPSPVSAAPAVEIILDEIQEDEIDPDQQQQEQTMEFTQSHGAIFLPNVTEEDSSGADQSLGSSSVMDTSVEMDFTRSHVFHIIQTAGTEKTSDIAAYYSNAGDETKELAEKYRSVLAQGQEATGELVEEEEEEEEDDLVSFKPSAADQRQSEPADETMAFTRLYTSQLLVQQPIISQPLSREEELGEPADETMNFTRSYTTNIVTAPTASPFIAPTPSAALASSSSDDQEECTMDFTRSFTAAIITNHATTTPGTTGFLSPLKFPGSSPTKAAPQRIAEEEEDSAATGGQQEVTMEFTRSFTSAIVAPVQSPQPTPEKEQEEEEEQQQAQQQDVTMEFTRSFTSAIVAPQAAAPAPAVAIAAAHIPTATLPRASFGASKQQQPMLFTAASLPPLAALAPVRLLDPAVEKVIPTQEQCEKIRAEAGILSNEMLAAKSQVDFLQAQQHSALEQARVIEAAALQAEREQMEEQMRQEVQAKQRAMVLNANLHAKCASKNSEIVTRKAEAGLTQLVSLVGFHPKYIHASGLQLECGQGAAQWSITVVWDGEGKITQLPSVDLSKLIAGSDAAYLTTVYAKNVHAPLQNILSAMTHRKHVAKAMPYISHLLHRLVTLKDELRSIRPHFTVDTKADGSLEVTVGRVDTMRQIIFSVASQTCGSLQVLFTIGEDIPSAQLEAEWRKIQTEQGWNRLGKLCQAVREWIGPQ